MKKLLLCIALVGCQPPAMPATCETACEHLRKMGCPEGQPTPSGYTCEHICRVSGEQWDKNCAINAEVCGSC